MNSGFNIGLNHYLDLPDDVFRLLRDAIYKRSGIYFSENTKYLVQKRLSPRARDLNFDSFQKYYYFLQYDPRADAEFDQRTAPRMPARHRTCGFNCSGFFESSRIRWRRRLGVNVC